MSKKVKGGYEVEEVMKLQGYETDSITFLQYANICC